MDERRPQIAPPGSSSGSRPPPDAGGAGAGGQISRPPVAPLGPRGPRTGPVAHDATRQRPTIARPGTASTGRPALAPAGSATRAADVPAGTTADELSHLPAAALASAAGASTLRSAVDNRTRRQRFAEPDAAESVAVRPAPMAVAEQPRLCVLLVTRNSGEALATAWLDWRQMLPGFEVRATVLDLGSVDDTFEFAERERLEVIAQPGGLVTPLEALMAGLQAANTEIVLVIDVAAPRRAAAIGLVEAVRAGASIAVAAGCWPGAVAIDRRRLPLDLDLGVLRDLSELADRDGLRVAVGGLLEVPGSAARRALVPRLLPRVQGSSTWRRLRRALMPHTTLRPF